MHLLLALTGPAPAASALHLERARRVLAQVMPPFPIPLTSTVTPVPGTEGAVLMIQPADTTLRRRVGIETRGALTVLFYGELFGVADTETGRHLLEAWLADGPDGVRSLDGNFGAAFINAAEGSWTILSDLIGRRTLRYAHPGTALVLTTHDLAAVATSLLPPEPALDAVASSAAAGWSLGGAPFLRDLHTTLPEDVLTWQNGELRSLHRPVLSFAGRLAPSATGEIDGHLAAMRTELVRLTRRFADGHAGIVTDLTAGLDSRCVLALALAAVPPDRLRAGTIGTDDTLDVSVARVLAARTGIRHDVTLSVQPDVSRFGERLDVLAFALNGDTDGKRALDDIFDQAEFVNPTPRLYGLASEIYRGYYYPGVSGARLRALTTADVTGVLQRRLSGIRSLPWRDPAQAGRLRALLDSRIARLSEAADLPVDLLDLFYAFERFGRWGALSARATWWSQYFAPFSSIRLLRMMTRLPAPMGYGVSLHRSLLRTLLPGAYRTPLVNGSTFIPLLGMPRLSSRVSGMLRLVHPGKKGGREAWTAGLLGSVFRGVAEEALSSSGSLTGRLFSDEGVRALLGRLDQGGAAAGSVGVLLSAERWFRSVQAAARAAAGEPLSAG